MGKTQNEHTQYYSSRGKQNIPQIHVNDHLRDICFHKSIPFFSGTSSKTGKYNRNLEPFPIRGTSRLNFPRREVFVTRDRELVQHEDVYA